MDKRVSSSRHSGRTLQHLRQLGTLRTAWIIHVVGNLLRAFGCKFIEPITYRLNQGKLPLFFSLAVSRQR
jgi:hypothetical protein